MLTDSKKRSGAMNIDKAKFGERVRSIRLSLGMSQEKFGLKMENKRRKENPANKAIVSSWERGISIPSPYRLVRIAELGNIPIDELLYGSIEEFITRVANEEIDRLAQERIENGDRTLTPSIKKMWLDDVINAELKEAKETQGLIDYANVADSVKRYLDAQNDFAYLIPSEAAEVIKANNLSSKELLHDVAPLADPKTYEEIIQHYDRIDDLLPKLEQ